MLELKSGLVRARSAPAAALDGAAGYSPSSFDAQVEKLSTELAARFYRHLYAWGSRRSGTVQPAATAQIAFEDGTTRELSTASSSGSFAVAAALAGVSSAAEWERLVAPASATGFTETYTALFPDSDPLDNSNTIDAQALPPSDFFQFPFPMGETWRFGGAHNWNGSGADWGRPYSSMDFSDVNLPKYAVAARGGTLYHPNNYSCWVRIDHGGGWTTSYYHLSNTRANGAIDRNQRVGEISTATCAGGSATGAHVHFSLLYNGAFADLDGVQLSGWTIDSGNGDYLTGFIERGGVRKYPNSYVLNDYAYSAQPAPAITSLWPPPPYCVLRYTREAEERLLEIYGRQLSGVEPSLQFRNLLTGEESIYFAYEVNWQNPGYATIDMASIKDFLWPDRKLSLAVRVTEGGAASYRPITDWSPPFYFADDVASCGAKLRRVRLYLPGIFGKR